MNIENKTGFKCIGADCRNHCCAAYNGISPNLIPMSGVNGSEIILLPEDVKSLKECGREDLIINTVSGIVTIKTQKDGTCYALKDGRCEVYEHRPAICRAYPLYLDMFTGINYLRECCAFNENIDLETCKDSIKYLLDIYQYWIDVYRGYVRDIV